MRVPGVCAYPKSLEEVAAPQRAPNPRPHEGHESRRHLIRMVPPVPGLWLCYTHADCECNQIVSATNRVLGVVPRPSRFGLRTLQVAARRLYRPLGVIRPWSGEEVVKSFNDKRKARYQQALDSFREREFDVKLDSKIKAFIKSEKFNPADKKNPDPRMIQARGLRYNVMLAMYLRPIEHRIYKIRSRLGHRIIAKGLNQVERACEIKSIWDEFRKPVAFSLDASRWDKHVDLDVLRVEHEVYKGFCSDPFFDMLLKAQEVNYCSTRGGVRWKAVGKRMSGDMNTALGNCLLAVAMALAARDMLGVPFEIFDDGDDCLLFCEYEHRGYLRDRLPGVYLHFGQELKLENEAHTLEDVVFCQAKPVYTNSSLRMVRNWRKVLSHGTSGVKHWNNPKLVRPMLKAVGSCELALNPGVPILQEYALALIRNSHGQRLKWIDVDSGLLLRARYELRAENFEDAVYSVSPEAITFEARESFERAWGVSPSEQEMIERILRGWTIDRVEAIDFPLELNSRWEDMTAPELQLPTCY